MSNINAEVNDWYDSLTEKKLWENSKSSGKWLRYKDDLQVTKSLLALLPQKVSHRVMVPIGPKALMPGKIVHTNEFLVNLGEAWFVKRSGFQTDEICNRRLKSCEEMLQKFKKERELIVNFSTLPKEKDAFGTDGKPEIIEYVTEEENEEWKKQHRIKEREYRRKLAELRNKEKKQIDTEEDLWKHLDELELQEELEDELNRATATNGGSENSDDSGSDYGETKSPSHFNEINCFNSLTCNKRLGNNNIDFTASETLNDKVKKRKVSFASDFESTQDKPLRLEIRHTNIESFTTDRTNTIIISPSDIYHNYIKSLEKTCISALKSTVNPNRERELKMISKESELDTSESDSNASSDNEITVSGIEFKDVTERSPFSLQQSQGQDVQKKRISKFKASRLSAAM